MTDLPDAVRLYADAMINPTDEGLAALRDQVADDIVVVGMFGAGADKETVLEALAKPQFPGLLGAGKISEFHVTDSSVTAVVSLPPGKPLGGIDLKVSLDGTGKISRVEQSQLRPTPTPATDLVLTEQIKTVINGALTDGVPIIVGYVDANGVPHLSPRASTHVFSDDQLAIWIRDPGGGILKAIETNPNLAVIYQNLATYTTLMFNGRAHAAEDEKTRQEVFATTPEQERHMDGQQRGVAVIIDLDRVEGLQISGRIQMERG